MGLTQNSWVHYLLSTWSEKSNHNIFSRFYYLKKRNSATSLLFDFFRDHDSEHCSISSKQCENWHLSTHLYLLKAGTDKLMRKDVAFSPSYFIYG